MLNIYYLIKSYTAEHLKAALLRCLNRWGLDTTIRPVFFVTNNGRDIVKAIELHENWHHIPCYAHCLQLAVTIAMKKYAEFYNLRKECREIVRFFSRSTSPKDKLLEIQRTTNPEKELL